MASSPGRSPELERNLSIFEQAFEYLSVDPSEKEKLIKLVEEKSQESENIRLTDIFRDEELISEEDIQYLKIFDAHLQTLSFDQQFGNIVLANNLASKQDVAQALKQQKEHFEKYRINQRIGDILVENKVMTNSDRIAILLTQNRIKNENLMDALNEMGVNPAEKEAVGKRFGVIAIKRELATVEQVKQALDIQRKERKDGGKTRFLGQILQETAGLTQENIDRILLEQKQFEKRRLDLEKAIYDVKSEIKISKKMNKLFEYQIIKDGVEIRVKKLKQAAESISVYEFIIWLKKIGIRIGIIGDLEIEEFLQKAEVNTEIVAAKGYPPQPCVHERIEFYFENETGLVQEQSDKKESDPDQSSDVKDDDSQNERKPDTQSEKEQNEKSEISDAQEAGESHSVVLDGEKIPIEEQEKEEPGEKQEDENPDEKEDTNEDQTDTDAEADGEKEEEQEDENGKEEVKSSDENADSTPEEKEQDNAPQDGVVKRGTLLARILPGSEGSPGKDVLGHIIYPGKPSICSMNAGSGVLRRNGVFISLVDGFPVVKNKNTIAVEPVQKKSEVEKLKGHIGEDTNEQYAGKTIEIKGNINAEGIIRCHGLTVSGHFMGCAICTGDVEIKGEIGTEEERAEGEKPHVASITAEGSIRIYKSAVNAGIQTAGELQGYNSRLIGSEVIANHGMVVRDVLNGKSSISILRLGIKPGDKIIVLDQTIEVKTAELGRLKKEDEIAELTAEYEAERKEEQDRLLKENIINNLIEVITGPELEQHEGLKGKLKYLESLPEYSSIKAYYLKPPETEAEKEVFEKIMRTVEEMSTDETLEWMKKQIEPEEEPEKEKQSQPEEKAETGETEETGEKPSRLEQIEIQYKARLNAFENEIAQASEQIEKIEKELQGLDTLRKKLVARHIKSMKEEPSEIRVRNKCEKGTVIMGKVSRFVVENSLYNVSFKEILNPKNNTGSIVVGSG